MPTIEERVSKLEQDLDKFNMRVSTLIWMAGILGVLGLTASGVSGWLVHTVKNGASEVEARQREIADLEKDESDAKSALKEIRSQIHEAQGEVSALDQIVKDKKKELSQYAGSLASVAKTKAGAAKGPTSRALAQVQSLESAVPQEPYYTRGYNEDVGQLFNCVDLYIAEMKSKAIPRDFEAQRPFYAAIESVYGTLLSRAQEKIGPANEPDAGNLKWHTFTWFQNFHETLQRMKDEHIEHGTLTDADLDDFGDRFRHHRDSVWGADFHDWPPALVP
jgi:hypothetical protein